MARKNDLTRDLEAEVKMPADSPAPTSPSEAERREEQYRHFCRDVLYGGAGLSRGDFRRWVERITAEEVVSSQERAAEAQARAEDLELMLRAASVHGIAETGELSLARFGLKKPWTWTFTRRMPDGSIQGMDLLDDGSGIPAFTDEHRAALREAKGPSEKAT